MNLSLATDVHDEFLRGRDVHLNVFLQQILGLADEFLLEQDDVVVVVTLGVFIRDLLSQRLYVVCHAILALIQVRFWFPRVILGTPAFPLDQVVPLVLLDAMVHNRFHNVICLMPIPFFVKLHLFGNSSRPFQTFIRFAARNLSLLRLRHSRFLFSRLLQLISCLSKYVLV